MGGGLREEKERESERAQTTERAIVAPGNKTLVIPTMKCSCFIQFCFVSSHIYSSYLQLGNAHGNNNAGQHRHN